MAWPGSDGGPIENLLGSGRSMKTIPNLFGVGICVLFLNHNLFCRWCLRRCWSKKQEAKQDDKEPPVESPFKDKRSAPAAAYDDDECVDVWQLF